MTLRRLSERKDASTSGAAPVRRQSGQVRACENITIGTYGTFIIRCQCSLRRIAVALRDCMFASKLGKRPLWTFRRWHQVPERV